MVRKKNLSEDPYHEDYWGDEVKPTPPDDGGVKNFQIVISGPKDFTEEVKRLALKYNVTITDVQIKKTVYGREHTISFSGTTKDADIFFNSVEKSSFFGGNVEYWQVK